MSEIFLLSLLFGLLLIWMMGAIAFLVRAKWIYEVRKKLLTEKPYLALPSYDYMMRRFWIWDVNKFLGDSNV